MVKEKPQRRSMGPPSWLECTFQFVSDPSLDPIVSWSSDTSFIVWDRSKLEKDVLPRYFDRKYDYSSFTNHLNAYGFTQVRSEPLEYANENFFRDKRELLVNIHRTNKTKRSLSVQNLQQTQGVGSSTLTGSERQVHKDEISTLKHDQQVLLPELEKHKEQGGFEAELQQLRDQLIRIEKRHNLVMLNVATRLHNPAELAGLESQRKDIESGRSRDPNSALFSIKEVCARLESSVTFWGDKLFDVNHTPVSCFSDPEPGGTTSRVERSCGPSSSGPQYNVDARSVTRVIGMSSEPPVAVPTASDTGPPREQHGGSTSTAADAGPNDAFWEEYTTKINPEILKIREVIEGRGSRFNVDAQQPLMNYCPSISGPQFNVDAPVIGMSLEPSVAVPSASDTVPPREQPGGSTSTAAVAGVSDPFGANIMTENPEMQDIGEFEGTGSSGRKNGSRGSADKGKGKSHA